MTVTVKDFYEKMKDIIKDPIDIMNNGTIEEYSGYMNEKKVYEYLFSYEITAVYIGKNDHIIIDVKEVKFRGENYENKNGFCN